MNGEKWGRGGRKGRGAWLDIPWDDPCPYCSRLMLIPSEPPGPLGCPSVEDDNAVSQPDIKAGKFGHVVFEICERTDRRTDTPIAVHLIPFDNVDSNAWYQMSSTGLRGHDYKVHVNRLPCAVSTVKRTLGDQWHRFFLPGLEKNLVFKEFFKVFRF